MNCIFLRRGYPEINKAPEILPNFADNEWSAIIYACQNNLVPSSWVVGDNKTMNIGGTNYQIDIIGRSHDDYADGSGKAPLTFQMFDHYNTKYKMNDTNTNAGGWKDCIMRSTNLPAIKALMPTSVQNAIKNVNKLTSAGSQNSTIITTQDELFLLSEVEIFGSTQSSFTGEGSRYEYYSKGYSVPVFDDYWWLRSPKQSYSNRFCSVNFDGAIHYNFASNTRYVLSAFCF